ncbi:hypothetical protein L7F22_007975 [Adiantum nelumboides]|nr:hypothetical protein [Adiantum nelumboides]
MENMQLKKLNEACSQKILSIRETIQGLEKKITSLQEKDTVLGNKKRKRDLCNIKNMKIGSGGLKKQLRALRSLLHPNSNSEGCNVGVHFSRLVSKEVVEEMITLKTFCKLKGRLLTFFMNENQLEPMEVQAILDESGIAQMGYRALFKALAKKSQNKLQRGSLLPKPSHVKVACRHVNKEVFEKLGSSFHIKATFLGKGSRKVQFNKHNNLFVDLEALQRYAVHFFDINREECDGVLKFVLKLDKCEVLKNNKLKRVTITLMNRALDPSITKEDPRYVSVQSENNILTLGSFQTYSGGDQFLGQAKQEFLKKRAFGSMETFGMSNVFSTTFSTSTVDVATISNLKANAAKKLKEKQQCLKAIKIALDQSQTKRDEEVGLMRGAAKIIERLNKDMEELKLHKAGLVPNEEAITKLETLIQIRKEALKDMGLDIEVHNLDNLGEEAAQLHTVVTDVYMLWCQHPYHPLCFVTACKSAGQCLFHVCEEPLKDALKLLTPGETNMDEHVDTEKDPMEGIFGSPVDGIAHSQAGSLRKPNIDSTCGGCGDKNASQKQAGEDTPDQQKAKKRVDKRANVVDAQGDAFKESAEVPLKPELAMNKDVEDAEKSSEKPNEKDTTVNLSDEDVDLFISNVCGEILGRRKKRSNTEKRASPKKKAKVASKPPGPIPGVELIFSPVSPAKWTVVAIEVQEINDMEINSLEELSWIGDVQEPDETVEDIAAKQDEEQHANKDVDVTPDKVEED